MALMTYSRTYLISICDDYCALYVCVTRQVHYFQLKKSFNYLVTHSGEDSRTDLADRAA